MKRTQKEYERIFEDLMEYSDFRSIEEVRGSTYEKTNKNLRKMFQQIHDDKSARGKQSRVSRAFAYEFGKAFWRKIKDRPTRERVHVTRKEQVLRARPVVNFETAKKNNLVAVNEKGKEVYRSYVVVKGKRVIRFRDSKGRFARKP